MPSQISPAKSSISQKHRIHNYYHTRTIALVFYYTAPRLDTQQRHAVIPKWAFWRSNGAKQNHKSSQLKV